jgi:hypothetical protein
MIEHSEVAQLNRENLGGAMNWGVFASTFLAASIEVIEMVAIVVAVGVTRSARAALLGAAGGLVARDTPIGRGRASARVRLAVVSQGHPDRLA